LPNLKNITRTCVFCRKKFEQKELIRLTCKDNDLILFNYHGRSFYFCKSCSTKILDEMKNKEYKRLDNILKKECKGNQDYVTKLKEILTYVR